jgi:hypothetical protein
MAPSATATPCRPALGRGSWRGGRSTSSTAGRLAELSVDVARFAKSGEQASLFMLLGPPPACDTTGEADRA